MKWSVVLLIALGLLAAVSASVLVGALRAFPYSASANDLSSKVEVVLAAKTLPAMSAIAPNDLTIKTISKENLPEGYLSDPVQAIGRIVAISVAQEQILTKTCFIEGGDRARLAAAIPHGMRAINITFPNNSISGGLLYPGCVVDILASFRLPSKSRAKGKAISTTLLQSIQVLAVENVSIVTKDNEEKGRTDKPAHSSNRKLMVTLMVNSRQAEALQLAREYGSISVAMRNPLDKNPVDSDSTVLNEGNLAKFGSLLAPTKLSPERKIALLKEMSSKSSKKSDMSSHAPLDGSDDQSEQWKVTVIRGKDVQIQKLDNSETEEIPLTDVFLD